MKEISVLILTHNAPKYVEETLATLNEVTPKETRDRLEIIVWDNASEPSTTELIKKLRDKGYIDKLSLSDKNLLFAGGNNRAAELASSETKYYLLLNSDIRINDPQWIDILLNAKNAGNYAAASYGACKNPNRADGYCLLVDKELYDQYKLDEQFQWWWSVTKLQAQILQHGSNILAFKNHDKILLHYGGKSGHDFVNAKGMDADASEILSWFQNSIGKVYINNAFSLRGLIDNVARFRK